VLTSRCSSGAFSTQEEKRCRSARTTTLGITERRARSTESGLSLHDETDADDSTSSAQGDGPSEGCESRPELTGDHSNRASHAARCEKLLARTSGRFDLYHDEEGAGAPKAEVRLSTVVFVAHETPDDVPRLIIPADERARRFCARGDWWPGPP